MKFSEQWLREWVNPAVGSDELVAQVTLAGLEVCISYLVLEGRMYLCNLNVHCMVAAGT